MTTSEPWVFTTFAPPQYYAMYDRYPWTYGQTDFNILLGFPVNRDTYQHKLIDFINHARHRIHYWNARLQTNWNMDYAGGVPLEIQRESWTVRNLLVQLQTKLAAAEAEVQRRANAPRRPADSAVFPSNLTELHRRSRR